MGNARVTAADCEMWHVCNQVKSRFTPPWYMEQCAARPPCPVRGGVGCKRCYSSLSCVGAKGSDLPFVTSILMGFCNMFNNF